MDSKDKDYKKFYDKIWEDDWHDMERFNPTARHLERIIVSIIKNLSNVKSVVDVGCGMGVNVKVLLKNFKDIVIVGTDISKKSLDLAKLYVGKDKNVKYYPLDISKKSLNKKFDVVLCSQVLEHIPDDVKSIKNLALMSSKYVLITVPSGKYNSTSKLVGHVRHYTKDELLSKVKSANLDIIFVREWGFPMHHIYKTLLDFLPEKQKRNVGLGKYSFFKKLFSDVIFLLFYINIFNKGDNIILLAKKKEFSKNVEK